MAWTKEVPTEPGFYWASVPGHRIDVLEFDGKDFWYGDEAQFDVADDWDFFWDEPILAPLFHLPEKETP